MEGDLVSMLIARKMIVLVGATLAGVKAALVEGGWSAALEIPSDLTQKGNVYYPSLSNQNDLVRNHQIKLARLYINLDPAKAGQRRELIAELEQIFVNAMSSGMIFIPRCIYDTSSLGGRSPATNLIDQDLDVLLPVFAKWKDGIYALQAGFLGSHWGEWWSTTNDIDEPDSGRDEKKRHLIQRFERFMQDTGVTVQLRYPRDFAVYGPDAPFGIHDDCILAQGWDGHDSGTFSKGMADAARNGWLADQLAPAKQWMAQKSAKSGGESCTDAGNAPTCDLLEKFAKTYKLCYINYLYPSTFRTWHDEAVAGQSSDNANCYRRIAKILADNCPAAASSAPAQPGAAPCQIASADDWVAGNLYSTGDIVTHENGTYKCLIAHLSMLTWAPGVWTQALWAQL